MRSSGFIFKAGLKAPPRARLDPYCRAQRPLFLSHPPRARALHPTRNTRWDSTGSTCVVDEPPRPPGQYQGVGLFAHGLAGNPRTSWLVPSHRQQWPDNSSPGDHPRPRTCRVGMVRPAQVRVAVTMPTQPPASCEAHQAPPGEKARRPFKVGPSGLIFYERRFLPCVFDDSKKNPKSRVQSLCSPPPGRPWTSEPLFLLGTCANLVRKGEGYGTANRRNVDTDAQ